MISQDFFCSFIITLTLWGVSSFGSLELIAQPDRQQDPIDSEVPLEFTQINQTLKVNDFDKTLNLLSKLRIESLKTRNKFLQEEVQARMKEVNRLKREYAKLLRYSELQKKKSKDFETNKLLGHFLV